MSAISLNLNVGKTTWCYWQVLDTDDYQSKVRPYTTLIVRSRGKHDPGSGNYFYGAVSAKDMNLVCNGDGVLYPGFHKAWYSEGNTVRYEFGCTDSTFYSLIWQKRGDRWFTTMQTGHCHYQFRTDNGVRNFHVYTDGCVPDRFFHQGSPEPISAKDFPWQDQEAYGVIGTYGITAVLSYYQLSIGDMMETLADGSMLWLDPISNEGLARAYTDAVAHAPINRVNNISNIISVVSLLSSLVEAPRLVVNANSRNNLVNSAKQLKKAVSDAWLQYRYVFTTSAMDIHELSDLCIRSAKGPCRIRCNGFHSMEVKGVKYKFHCAIHLTPDQQSGLQSDLEKFGVALSAYNAWDMVPYSFIVDWFLKISDRLEFYEDRNRALKLVPGVVWYSVTKQFETDRTVEDYYFRFASENSPPMQIGFCEHGDAGKKTIVKRAIDVLALI